MGSLEEDSFRYSSYYSKPHDKQTSSYASLDIFILVEIPELDLLAISEAITRYLALC